MPPKNRKDGQNKRERYARQYGFVTAFFDQSPELKDLFNKAVKKTWTTERFVAELRDTKWFRKNSVSVRNALMQKTADPATYKARVSQVEATIRDMWGAQFGATAAPMLDKGELRKVAATAYTMGWSEAQIMDYVTKSMNWNKLMRQKQLGGTAGDLKNKIEALGRSYGVNPSNKYIAGQVEKIIEGRDSFEGTAYRLKEWAKREYKSIAAELDGGATVEEVAEPYMQKMAEMLELNPETVNLRGRTIRQALRQRDDKGNWSTMSMTDFEDRLRKDRRWQYTDNAKQQVAQATEGLLRDFGLIS